MFCSSSGFEAAIACTSKSTPFPLLAVSATGCATSNSTLIRPDQGGTQVIYRISEQQAFTIALEAYAVLTPKQSVDDIRRFGLARAVPDSHIRAAFRQQERRRRADTARPARHERALSTK